MDGGVSNLNKKLFLGLLGILMVVIACYGIEDLSRETGTRSGKIITVVRNGQPLAMLGIDVLKEVAQQTKQVGSGEIPLSKALSAAGVEDYHAVKVSGTGLESIYVKRDQTDAQVLRFNRGGAADLYARNKIRVRKVNLLEIE